MIVGDLVDAGFADIRTGPFGTQLKASEYVERGRPVLNVRNVGLGDVRAEKLEHIGEETANRLAAHLLVDGDIVFGRKGAVERHAFIRDEFVGALQGSDCIRLRLKPESPVRPHFVSFALRTAQHQAWMQAYCSHGATMASLNQDILRQIRLPDLSLEAQDAVIEVLGSMDDLIENNRRRVQVLEEMAQAVYREWFVHFRYPGHENVPLVESELGLIPDGWEFVAVGDLAVIDKGLSYKGAHLALSGTPMANLKCFHPGGGFRRDGAKPYDGPFQARHRVSPGDLVLANTDLTQAGSVIGSPALIPRKGFEGGGIASHHLFIVRPLKDIGRHWLFESFRNDRFRAYARGVASGTTVLGFRPADLATYPILMPPPGLVARFEDAAAGFADLREDLAELTEVLELQRDLLLPKLVNGQIDMSQIDLDALTEPAVPWTRRGGTRRRGWSRSRRSICWPSWVGRLSAHGARHSVRRAHWAGIRCTRWCSSIGCVTQSGS